jgi:hypothetical protein
MQARGADVELPHLDDLKLFVAVVEAGGFRPAAQRLGLTAATVSDVVRQLEESLGLRLPNRSTRGVMPTEAGRRVLLGVMPAFELIDRAVSGLHDDAERPAFGRRHSGDRGRYFPAAHPPKALTGHVIDYRRIGRRDPQWRKRQDSQKDFRPAHPRP